MIIFYSKHAQKRMEERHITREEVEEAISHPDRTVDEHEQVRIIKELQGMVLIVIIRNTSEGPFIITAFFSSKHDKYLQL